MVSKDILLNLVKTKIFNERNKFRNENVFESL